MAEIWKMQPNEKYFYKRTLLILPGMSFSSKNLDCFKFLPFLCFELELSNTWLQQYHVFKWRSKSFKWKVGFKAQRSMLREGLRYTIFALWIMATAAVGEKDPAADKVCKSCSWQPLTFSLPFFVLSSNYLCRHSKIWKILKSGIHLAPKWSE